jgi:hypothetical protein
MFLITPIVRGLQDLAVFTWDFGFQVINLATPSLKAGHVIPEGHPGAGGKWPEYIPPKDGDSRCSCPALNTMANHGIIPRDGKNISFKEMSAKLCMTYNCAPSFCFFVPNYAARMLNKNYETDSIDLADLDLHNGIEHDASLTREDSALVPNQAHPHIPFIKELLASATGKDKDGNPTLTSNDLAAYSAKRRVDAKVSNPEFTLDLFHKIFGSSNSSTLITIFGGHLPDIESFLIHERLPEGWESRVRSRMGMTIASFNLTVLPLEFSTSEEKYRPKQA